MSSIPRSEQSTPGAQHTNETCTAFCTTCPDPQEVEQLLQAFGFHLVFSLPADTAGEYQTDLPPLPAQYHYEDVLGTQVEYLAGVDTPSLDDNPGDGEGLSPMRFPPHASRFWLTMGGQELAARRVQARLADQWALHWREWQREPSFEAVA